MNVLFCDDEPDLLEIYGLEFEYYSPENTIFKADSPEGALEICKAYEIDVIFTDSKMPNMTGLQLLKNLREENIFPKKAYMITGYINEFEQRDHEIYDYVDEVLPKPPDFEELVNLVRRFAVSETSIKEKAS